MKVLGLSGSLRAGSHNSKLLRAAGDLLPGEAELVEFDGLKQIPPFDEDDERSRPATVQALFDAVAVLIAVVTLGQLPIGPGVGAAAAVLILGSDGVAAAAAAGVLMTVTGTVGGLCFATWAGGDHLWSRSRRAGARRERRTETG